ncbi:cobalt-precorrin-6A reductase [Methylobacterium haplocladii]|uniref:Precorrin-6A reductase n=1 Tax=Methylobacterium haplocladii TaxID=1176176 RepID=A0A512IUV3_9HYPH|nr:cobalt-precorrin-6A reductase [Methylobacterium haplocladii]GEP01463.1 precorrin-6A reductase [Methylobacterium haplocladii]GJD85006.1 Precorrin-6A reductase [Methylobacterium haplocladii]GLS58881.1 precorrin-6A reductase [Methylobacterium haplocladii]
MGSEQDGADRLPVLILGGTTEASALARALATAPRLALTLSLAGRTLNPTLPRVPTRLGGFGGAEGLAAWIAGHRIARVVDATHPFAARISRNAATACAQTGVMLLAIRRPPWDRMEGDRWIEVDDMAAAAAAVGSAPRRVFLTIGRQELGAFAAAPQHDYVARTIEPIGDALSVPRLTEITARGPFTLADEIAFLREAGIEVLVTKNSGGTATSAKIAAARELGLSVIILRQPNMPDVPSVPAVEGAIAWLSGCV